LETRDRYRYVADGTWSNDEWAVEYGDYKAIKGMEVPIHDAAASAQNIVMVLCTVHADEVLGSESGRERDRKWRQIVHCGHYLK
jgi:hypothetical protein